MTKPLPRPQKLAGALERLFFCPSCSIWRLPPRRKRLGCISSRESSTLSSSTAINASKSIPARLKPLHTALGELRRKAPAYVSLSRLQLAEQGLESETPKIRVAVLGFNVQDNAKRVARLLLADALEPEQEWEKQLLDDPNYEPGVLIRYGRHLNSNLPQPRMPIPTLTIPAPLLEKYNLEILVSSISSGIAPERGRNGQIIPTEAFLAPTIGTPTAASGRQTIISQPVHTSLVITKGLNELMSMAELLATTKFQSEADRASIKVAVIQRGISSATGQNIAILDPESAEEGLKAIRTSIVEATTFEHKWVDSGMPALSAWLSRASDTSGEISRSVKRLLSALLDSAASNIQTHAASDQVTAISSRLSLASKTNLEMSIDDFSRNAHSELQSGLSSAWSSRNWRKLAWYKLFWRVDDVGLIVSDLVSNAWLPRTERAVYELSGRLSQVGISPIAVARVPQPSSVLVEDPQASPVPAPLPVVPAQVSFADQPAQEPVITNTTGSAAVSMIPAPRPTPLSAMISIARSEQITRAINDLTFTAQQLVFRALSISGLSAGLSGLTYLSLTPGSLYEAGTIAALGTAFALYRMQGSWQRATKDLEENLFAEGRSVIQNLVAQMRELVAADCRRPGDALDRNHTQEAMEAVRNAQAELEKVIGQLEPEKSSVESSKVE